MLAALRYPIIPMTFDRSVIDLMILPQSRRDQLETLFRGSGMSHGDVARCIDLAFRCAEQCLREPMPLGTRVAPTNGRGSPQIVVGCKPNGFRERPIPRRTGSTCMDLDGRWDEALLWTVDPSSKRPGISQSRMSDWKRI
jgi:hypothetical protein